MMRGGLWAHYVRLSRKLRGEPEPWRGPVVLGVTTLSDMERPYDIKFQSMAPVPTIQAPRQDAP